MMKMLQQTKTYSFLSMVYGKWSINHSDLFISYDFELIQNACITEFNRNMIVNRLTVSLPFIFFFSIFAHFFSSLSSHVFFVAYQTHPHKMVY